MNSKSLNWFFVLEVILFGLIITGVLPREVALYLGVALVIYFLAVPVEDSLVFVVRSIPLFLAMPFTADFDNFNVWRILVVIVFLKWFAAKFSIFPDGKAIKDPRQSRDNFSAKDGSASGGQFSIKSQFSKLKNSLKPSISPSFFLIVLLFFAVLSIIPAPDKIAAIKRIIYFLNFAVLGVVIYDKASNKEIAKRLIKNSIILVIIVAAVGYTQVVSTYFVDIYQFMRIWGEGIQCRQFGEQSCNIA